MSTLTLRSDKGSPLTNAEVDGNFSNLNTDKIEVTGSPANGQAIVWNGTAWVPATLSEAQESAVISFAIALG
jgi:hypothetical protein